MSPDTDDRLKDVASLRIDRDALESRRPHGRLLRGLVLLVVLAALVAGGVAAWRMWVEPLRMAEVRVVTAIVQSGDQTSAVLTASGYIVAQRQAAVTSKIPGRLAELSVREGSRVRSGEVIGRLESREYEAQIDEARKALAATRADHAEAQAREYEARREHERQQRLIEEEVSSQSDYDAAEARWKVARAQVESAAAQIPRAEAMVTVAEVALQNTLIIAPFDGVVTTKSAEVGEIVAPVSVGGPARGNSVVLIADMDSLEAEVDVNEGNIGRIREGLPAEIVLDAYPERRYPGVLRQIVPTANRQKATIQAKVRFTRKGDEVLPEMAARVNFLETAPAAGTAARPPRIFAPRNAIVTREGRSEVLVVRDGRVSVVRVEVGPEVEGRVEILSGLRGGESLVADPPASLSDGSRVRIRAST